MKNKHKTLFYNLFIIGFSLLIPLSSISLSLSAFAATDREIMENTGFADENLFNCVLSNMLRSVYYYPVATDDFNSFRTDYYAGTATEIPTVVLENLRDLQPFYGCPNITITDFKGFEKLKGLSFLNLAGGKITNTLLFEFVLSSLPKLSFLILGGIEFNADRLNLSAMESLEYVSINGSSIDELDITQDKKLKYIQNTNDTTIRIGLAPGRICDESECYFSLDLSEYNFFDGYSHANWLSGYDDTASYKSTFAPIDDSFTYDSDSKIITVPERDLASPSSLGPLTLVRTEQIPASLSNPEGIVISNINIIFDLLLPDSPDKPEEPENEAPETAIIPKAPNTGFFTSATARELF